jgi:hypothetical protein
VVKLRIHDTCEAVNPDTGVQCEREKHWEMPHVHSAWECGEITGPVWWYETELRT